MDEKIIQKEKVNQIIREIAEKGYFEKKANFESFRVEADSPNYKVIVFDSETDKNSEGKIFYHDLAGIHEYLTAMVTEPGSILNRL